LEHPDDGGKTLSISDWTKIMAYMFIPKNEHLQAKFEEDPASTVQTIKENIEAEFVASKIKINFTAGQTALFRLGDPPNEKIINTQDLQAIRDNPNTYARVMVRITC
jgi:hypothetical protein